MATVALLAPACLRAALFLGVHSEASYMVHCRASVVRDARRVCARLRGYIRPLAPGARLHEVPAPRHGQLKTMAG